MSGEDYGGHEAPRFEMKRLADGTEVPKTAVVTLMLNLGTLSSGEYGEIARIDLAGLAQGRQPARLPGFDMASIYDRWGFCDRQEDGSLVMHDQTAAIVRNAIRISRDSPSHTWLADPTSPFEPNAVPPADQVLLAQMKQIDFLLSDIRGAVGPEAKKQSWWKRLAVNGLALFRGRLGVAKKGVPPWGEF